MKEMGLLTEDVSILAFRNIIRKIKAKEEGNERELVKIYNNASKLKAKSVTVPAKKVKKLQKNIESVEQELRSLVKRAKESLDPREQWIKIISDQMTELASNGSKKSAFEISALRRGSATSGLKSYLNNLFLEEAKLWRKTGIHLAQKQEAVASALLEKHFLPKFDELKLGPKLSEPSKVYLEKQILYCIKRYHKKSAELKQM